MTDTITSNEELSVTAEILLLEQNADETRLIRQASERHQLNVVQACPEILAYLRRQGRYSEAARPHLILLDLDLSETVGCETLSEIKQSAELKRIPVVVLAASDSYDDIFRAYDLHANAYICKPEDEDRFVSVIKATLHFWLALARLPKE